MSAPKFTPGSWRVESDRQGCDCVVGPRGVVADTIGMEANAHLIAAAPDLYAALQALMPVLDDLTTLDEPFPAEDAVIAARAALAKADGEPNDWQQGKHYRVPGGEQ